MQVQVDTIEKQNDALENVNARQENGTNSNESDKSFDNRANTTMVKFI